MTPSQSRGAGKRNAPAVPLAYYDEKLEQRTPNLFFVFYNGEVTEENYFNDLCKDLAGKKKYDSHFRRLKLKFIHQAPQQIVQTALDDVKATQQTSATNTEEDVVWVVFDKDDFGGNYTSAISLAGQNKIKIAYSNECFALWLLLHFQEQTSKIGRGQLEEFLRKKWEETKGEPIDNKKEVKHFPYGIARIQGDRTAAIERAKNLYEQAEVANPQAPWEVNPVTTVYELVEQLIEFFGDE